MLSEVAYRGSCCCRSFWQKDLGSILIDRRQLCFPSKKRPQTWTNQMVPGRAIIPYNPLKRPFLALFMGLIVEIVGHNRPSWSSQPCSPVHPGDMDFVSEKLSDCDRDHLLPPQIFGRTFRNTTLAACLQAVKVRVYEGSAHCSAHGLRELRARESCRIAEH